MKIISEYFDSEEPMECNSCEEEQSALNYLEIKLFENFRIYIWLCDKCRIKLKKEIRKK